MKRFSKFIQESIELDEKLKASDDMGDWVKDFQDSDAPQFKGKSQKKRQQMAIAAKLSANEEVELDEAETKYVIKHKKNKQVLNTHDDYATAKDEHEGLGADKKNYGVYKQTKKDAALRNRNTYREEVELDEAKTDIYHKHMLKALGKSRLPKNHSYTSAIATNGDFVVHDGGGRVAGRIPKGEHNLNEVSDKKLDAYRQKAFADQPAGDDGSDKYRKRKFGRDLAFAKQTGRAKVLATKEEVDLDEVYQEAANYLVSEGIELEDLNEEELNELIGAVARGIGRGLKSTAVNKKGNFRFSTAGRADATQKKADSIEKRQRDRERLQKQRDRLQRLRQARNT